MLSYTPLLSILNLVQKKNQHRFHFEWPFNSDKDLLSVEYLSNDIKQLLLNELDFFKSYFTLNWVFLFNLRERCRDSRAPSALIYYKLHQEKDGQINVRVIGAQLDSITLMQQFGWGGTSYSEANERLKEFIDFESGISSLRRFKQTLTLQKAT